MGVDRPVKPVRRVLQSLNCDGRLGWALLAACAVLLLPTLAGEAGRQLLRYDRVALEAGGGWRLLTAPVGHLDTPPPLLEWLGPPLMLALFAPQYFPRHLVAHVTVATAC